jgi:hypothetical protein
VLGPTTIWSGSEQPDALEVGYKSVYLLANSYPTGELIQVTPK